MRATGGRGNLPRKDPGRLANKTKKRGMIGGARKNYRRRRHWDGKGGDGVTLGEKPCGGIAPGVAMGDGGKRGWRGDRPGARRETQLGGEGGWDLWFLSGKTVWQGKGVQGDLRASVAPTQRECERAAKTPKLAKFERQAFAKCRVVGGNGGGGPGGRGGGKAFPPPAGKRATRRLSARRVPGGDHICLSLQAGARALRGSLRHGRKQTWEAFAAQGKKHRPTTNLRLAGPGPQNQRVWGSPRNTHILGPRGCGKREAR